MSISVHVDVSEAVKGIHELERKHIPFALAATLTNLAKGSQAKVKAGLGSKFKLRNSFTEQGIRITPAKKNAETIQADVHTDTANRKTGAPDYMGRQEEGGDKVPHEGRMHIAVPTKYLRQMIGDGPIPAEMRPRALLGAVGGRYTGHTRKGQIALRNQVRVRGMVFFLLESKGKSLIMGRYWTEKEAYPFYVLVPEVHVRERLHMEKDVESYCVEHFEQAWQEQWERMRAKGLRLSL